MQRSQAIRLALQPCDHLMNMLVSEDQAPRRFLLSITPTFCATQVYWLSIGMQAGPLYIVHNVELTLAGYVHDINREN